MWLIIQLAHFMIARKHPPFPYIVDYINKVKSQYVFAFNPGIQVSPFLVGAFSLKEKSPTITVGSFFSFSAYNLTLNGPLFLQSLFICSTNFLKGRRSWVRFSH